MSNTLAQKIIAGKPSPAQKKLVTLRKELDAGLVGRGEEIDLTLTAITAQTTLLFVGPPGTSKSWLLESAFRAVTDAKKPFIWLMGKFTEPDEIFGPVDILSLKQGKRRRVTSGKLPEAHAAFLDEFWKSSTAIANALLRVVNERVYDNGEGEQKVPLRVLVAASNEYPQDGELGAMFDRFVLRADVEYLTRRKDRARLMRSMDHTPKLSVGLTVAELDRIHAEAMALPFPEETWARAEEIVEELIKAGIRPSDRRLPLIGRVGRAYAYLQGSSRVEPEHLSVLRHMLWNTPGEQARKCSKIVLKLANPVAMKARDLLLQAEDVAEKCLAEAAGDPLQREKRASQARGKLQLIQDELQTLKEIPDVAAARAGVQDCVKRVLHYGIGVKA